MKKIIIYITFILAIPTTLLGQYSGSIGGGDAMVSSGLGYLDDNYFSIGGAGRGDALSMIFLPVVSTQTVTNITTTTATANGTVVMVGAPNTTQYGVVWSTMSNPTTVLSTKTTLGVLSTPGTFTSSLTGLLPNVIYYVRSYATNNLGTNYGTEVTFKTTALQLNVLPTATIGGTNNSTTQLSITSTTTWTAGSNQAWLSASPATGFTGNGNLTLTALINPAITTRSAIITLKGTGAKDTTINVTQAAGPATLSVSANTASVLKTTNSTASVTVTSNSTWTATSDQTWLTVTPGGTSNGTLTVTTTADNPFITTRSATITIKATGAADKTVIVTQAVGDATFSISANTASIAKAANSTASITIISNSPWSATSNQTWLTVTPGGNGYGSLTFTTTSANPSITTQIAIVTIKVTGASDKTVTVTQAVGDATLSVNATATITKTVNSYVNIIVTSNSTWTATSNQSWLTVNSGATGNGNLSCIAASTNTTIFARIATVTLKATGITDQTVTITQEAGDATLTVSSTTASVTKEASSIASITVTSNSTWTVTSNQSWLNVSGGATGDGTLTFTTSSVNPYITTRSATVTLKATGVADKTVTVTQAVGDPTLSVSANTANIIKTANSTSSINLISNTTWTANSDQNWLSVVSGGTGNVTLTFTANTTNPVITTRIATVTIKATGTDDQVITITQAVGDATLSVSAATANITNTANVTTKINIVSNSLWSASSDQSWLLVKSYGNGDFPLPFSATSINPLANPRQAIITIKVSGANDKTITVTQAGATPTFELPNTEPTVAKTANATASINVTSNATWTTASNQSWLSVSSGNTGNGSVTFTALSANTTIATRSAIITFKVTGLPDRTLTVTQLAGDATLSTSANSASLLKTANSSASIIVISNTTWTATSDQKWLTITSGGTGNSTLTLTTNTSNPTIRTRTATVTLKFTGTSDKTITVTQAAGNPNLSVSATNASVLETSNSTAWVTVYSNTTWTATSNQSWLKVTPSGNGDDILAFTATANTLITSRTAIVTVKATGVTNKTITVTQQASAPFVIVTNNSVVLDPKANNTASVNISSNTVWNVVTDQNWLSVNSANGILSFSAANATTSTRQAIVTISAAGVTDVSIKVIQTTSENKYQLNMTVTSIATIDDIEISNGDIQLSAFIDGECRGTTTLKYVESYKRYMVFLMVWGNAEDFNKTISFKSYDPTTTNELTAINTTLKFIPESITGSPTNPYSIDFAKKITNINLLNNENIDIYPNPVIDAFRIKGLNSLTNITLTDMNGKILLQKQVNVNQATSVISFPKGMYVLKMTNNDGVIKRKVIKQ
jgi:hypothetical protein